MTFNELQKAFKTVEIDRLIQDYGITLIMIFGSVAKETSNANSDIDIAVLLNEQNDEFHLKIRFRLIDFFEKIFKKNCDVILLNEAPPQLKYQIFKYGRLLLEKDNSYNKVFTQTLKEYFDFIYFANFCYIKIRESFMMR